MKPKDFESRFDDTDFTVGKVIKWLVYMLVIVTVIGVGGRYLGLFGQVATLPADVASKTLTPDNAIYNYEWFYDFYAAYQAKLGQIKTHKQIVAETTDRKELARLRIELAAMQQMCREIVTKYDANATKTNRSIFMGREAPQSLEVSTCE